MKRFLILLFATLFGLSVLVFAQADVISIDYGSKLFKPTEFQHKAHATERVAECSTCHHTEKQVACGTCHMLTKTEEAPKAKDAFHKLCKKCHQQKRSEGLDPPVSCTGCHEKK